MIQEYPKDFFIRIEGDEHRIARLTVNMMNPTDYSIEIDIVHKESKKIWDHVGQIFHQSSEEEGIENGIQYLSNYLNRQNND